MIDGQRLQFSDAGNASGAFRRPTAPAWPRKLMQEEAGVLVAFQAKDGKFLWQDVAPRVERGLREFCCLRRQARRNWKRTGCTCAAECQLRCLDTQGFRDGENNGPNREELFQDNAAANVNGRMQVLFGGGDGWLRAYDAASGHEVWRFDGNPKDARWLPRPGVLSRSSIIASPVFADGRVFVAMGQDPLHGNGPSLISCDQSQRPGDVTASSRSLCTQAGEMTGAPICGAPLHM